MLFGGGYAVLLQLAHPFVTAGVDDHSYFRRDTLSRLFRTIDFIHTLVFADRKQVQNALRHFHTMHERLKGRLGERAGSLSPDDAYSGVDPEAKLWVFATLVDAGLRVYSLLIQPLDNTERQQFYAESLVLGRLLAIPEAILPPTLDAFQDYMQDMLNSDTLAVTETTRELARAVLYPDVGFWPGLGAPLLRLVTIGLLPERFQKAYGFKWDRRRAILLQIFAGAVRRLRPLAPGWIWKTPMQGGKLARGLVFRNLREFEGFKG